MFLFSGFRLDFLRKNQENPGPGQFLLVSYSTIWVHLNTQRKVSKSELIAGSNKQLGQTFPHEPQEQTSEGKGTKVWSWPIRVVDKPWVKGVGSYIFLVIATKPPGLVYGVHLFILAIFGRPKMMMIIMGFLLCVFFEFFLACQQSILGTLNKIRTRALARACAGGRVRFLVRFWGEGKKP